jgi:hypothetical protein
VINIYIVYQLVTYESIANFEQNSGIGPGTMSGYTPGYVTERVLILEKFFGSIQAAEGKNRPKTALGITSDNLALRRLSMIPGYNRDNVLVSCSLPVKIIPCTQQRLRQSDTNPGRLV